ncbi:hypothetical protein AAE02nite_36180 [Adhaeribacter aerolatus]|uniref:Uncharacterized protein n=1 Tax=Adhaeribacter aerolatus TaxID=670289 RepID=A0A512B1W4_9BACT|nr:hypothetical protein [Adhaeribacter aerolatus]GEO05954.1 hypothetical protein AAE02nite_36180 [Adhaeribacter aerolatus]
MIKAFLKYLLPLCIVLLAFLGQLTAHAPTDSAYLSPVNQLKRSVQASLALGQPEYSFLIKATDSDTRKGSKIVATVEKEAEEVESSSAKKFLESSTFFTAVLSGQIFAYLFKSLEKYLAFCKSYSSFSSHRWYLLFRVFRI